MRSEIKETIKDLMPVILLILLSVYIAITLVQEPTVMAEEDVSMDVTEIIETTWETIPPEPQIAEPATETESMQIRDENETEQDFYDNLELLAYTVMAEAGNQGELGKRLVIDCILNRVDSEYFPSNVHDVIYQKNPTQFAVTTNGSLFKNEPTEDIYTLISEEIKERTNTEVIYFNSIGFTKSGEKWQKIGDHYFSKIRKELQK